MPTPKTNIALVLRAFALLLALTLLLVGYYWVHKPLSNNGFLMFGGALLDTLTVSALVAVAAGAGRFICALVVKRLQLMWDDLSSAEQLALEAGVGLALISMGALTLGLVGLYTRVALWLPFLLLGIVLRRSITSWFRALFATLRAGFRLETPFQSVLAFIALLLLGLALLHAFKPIYEWDAIVYHLVEPQAALRAGRLLGNPENFYLGFPKGVEVLYGVLMSAFGRDTAAAPLHFVYGALALLATAGFAVRHAGRTAAWIAIALLIGSFNVWQLFGWAYVDLAVLLYAALAFSLYDAWRRGNALGWLLLLGAMSGIGLGIKYTTGFLVIALALGIVVAQPRRALPNLLIVGLAAALLYAPWAVRGFLLYGDPFYPYLHNFLPSANWDADRAAAFSQSGRGLIGLGQAWQATLIPFTATVLGQNYDRYFSFTLGPFLLTAPLLLTIVWRSLNKGARRLARDGAVLLIILYGMWAILALFQGIAMQARLMMVMFPISAILGAIGISALSQLPEKPVNVGFILRVAFLFTTAFALLEIFEHVVQIQLLPALTGQMSAQEFRFRHIATHEDVLGRLAALPDGSQVRFAWEPRNYFCPATITCVPDVLFDHWSHAITAEDMTADRVFTTWREAGDDYLLFFRLGYDAFDLSAAPAIDAQFAEAVEAHLQQVWTTEDGRYVLYGWE